MTIDIVRSFLRCPNYRTLFSWSFHCLRVKILFQFLVKKVLCSLFFCTGTHRHVCGLWSPSCGIKSDDQVPNGAHTSLCVWQKYTLFICTYLDLDLFRVILCLRVTIFFSGTLLVLGSLKLYMYFVVFCMFLAEGHNCHIECLIAQVKNSKKRWNAAH